MADAQMEDAHDANDAFKEANFSEPEKEILDMYDQVLKLELEVALTRARVRLARECAPLLRLFASANANDS